MPAALPTTIPTPMNACTCPLCGQANHCAMEVARSSGQDVGVCWCVNTTFSPELLARIPAAAQRKACICQTCATQAPNTTA